MRRRGFAPVIGAILLLVAVTGTSTGLALVLNGTNFVNKASTTWDDTCSTDSDCRVVQKTDRGINCCQFGCGITNYNDSSWVSVNSRLCNMVACPMLACLEQTDTETPVLSSKCVFNKCQKVVVEPTLTPTPTQVTNPCAGKTDGTSCTPPSPGVCRNQNCLLASISITPTPVTCAPMPPCLYTKPYCYIAEPADGWCPRPTGQPTVTPYPSITAYPTITTSVTPVSRPGNRYGQEKNKKTVPENKVEIAESIPVDDPLVNFIQNVFEAPKKYLQGLFKFAD